LLGEALRGFKADKFLSITSVVTIGICSSLFAFLLAILFLALSFTRESEGPAKLRVFTHPAHEDAASLVALETKLRRLGATESIQFIPKDSALAEFRRDFGKEMLESLENNPLPHSFILTVRREKATSAHLASLRDRILRFEEVEEAGSEAWHLAGLQRWKLPLQLGSLLLILFVSGALALIVRNAVKLNLYARRSLVENMKYCGASQLFILTPFVLEGALLGAGGSLLGLATLSALKRILALFSTDFPGRVPFTALGTLLLLSAVCIATFTSARTVRAFLAENAT
jgi:cell division transport system permease protein